MEYKVAFDNLVIDPDKVSLANAISDKIKSKKDFYAGVSLVTLVPWYVVGVIHYRESSLSFKCHLHNGDPLTARTIHVPKGRPIKGNAPFTWEESAIDALKLKNWHKVTDWSIPNALSLIEKYNGLGYKNKGLPSPYVWSWSDKYKSGKYVADGEFDPNVVDKQCGTAVLLKLLI